MRILNNHQIIISLHYEASLHSGMSNNLSSYGSSHSSLIFYFFLYVLFLSKGNVLEITIIFCVLSFLLHNIVAPGIVCFCSLWSMLSGDAELNPVPLSNCKEYFWICQWNLTSISVHDYSKLFLLKAYIILHKFNIICLSETYLDSTAPTDADKLQFLWYPLICCDHPSNTKRGRVSKCFRSSLPLRVINIGYLHKCLSYELQIGNKICNFVALYRSPSQSQDDFETFADNSHWWL